MRTATALLAAALLVRVVAAAVVRHPGYMDAYYYYHVARELAAGQGLSERVAWNYLAAPPTLPRPAGAYWPPGTSLLAATGLALLPGQHGAPADDVAVWRAAQAASVLTSSLVALGAYALTRRLSPGVGSRRRALAVWGLVVFSGVYFPYWVTTDTFTPFALVGGAVLWLAAEAAQSDRRATRLAAASALLAGLAQWIRPDAPLLLAAPCGAVLWPGLIRMRSRLLPEMAVVAVSFAAGLAPWIARNVFAWGTPTPPGTTAALWLTDYGDLFAFRVLPSVDRWQAAGIPDAIAARLAALAGNAAVLGQPLLYYLVPAAALGIWHVGRAPAHRPALASLLVLYVTQSVLFPFQSVRGGLFHSLSAALPFLALWTVLGVQGLVAAAARRRGWREWQAQAVFAGALVAFGVLSSVYFLALQTSRWDARLAMYGEAASLLGGAGSSDSGARVMAVDPPGFWYASHRDAIAIPSDGFDALLAAARQFDARFLVVEASGPPYLAPLWAGDRPVAGFTCLAATSDVAVYRITADASVASTSCPPAPARAAPVAPGR